MTEISQVPSSNKFFSKVLECFFYHLYNHWAWLYDTVAFIVSAGRWGEWVRSITQVTELKGKLLELGHGTGQLMIALNKCGLDAYGIDHSKQMGKIAKTRLEKENLIPTLITSGSQWLPFPGDSFDFVLSTFPTSYIFDSLEEMYRVLVPGGKVIVLLAVWITGKSFIDRLLNLLFKITGETPSDVNVDAAVISIPDVLFKKEVVWLDGRGARLLFVCMEKRYDDC